MTPPLTRRDVQEVVEEVLDRRLTDHPTHAELREALANHPTHAQLAAALAEQRAQIAADTRAMNAVLLEDAFRRFRVIDDQYKDLPGRVQKLEEAVFSPAPRARRKRSG